MNIARAKEEIKNTVKAYLTKDEKGQYEMEVVRQRPILLIGPPGIGKTQIMEQIAEECEIGLVAYTITHHTRQSAVGLPMITEREYEGRQYSVTEYTMSEIIATIYETMKSTGKKEGLLFIDEINCVSETLMPAMLQFLQGKSFANEQIPSGWIIVAAGNPPEYNRSVRDFDMVTMDRVRLIRVEAELDVWKAYAIGRGIHGAIMSYLELRPANFYRTQTSVDGMEFVTARGWEDLSVLLKMYEKLGIEITEETIYEYLRIEEQAEDFYTYYSLYEKYKDDYNIEGILSGEAEAGTYERLMKAEADERICVTELISDKIGEEAKVLYDSGVLFDAERTTESVNLGITASTWDSHVTNAIGFLTDCFGDEGSTELLLLITELSMKKEVAVSLSITFENVTF